jgi:hypothetical protein
LIWWIGSRSGSSVGREPDGRPPDGRPPGERPPGGGPSVGGRSRLGDLPSSAAVANSTESRGAELLVGGLPSSAALTTSIASELSSLTGGRILVNRSSGGTPGRLTGPGRAPGV